MKVLLIALNAKYIHSNPALYSLRAYAVEKSGGLYKETIEIAEYTINHKKETILADIYKRKPDMVAFSCYIWNFELIQDIMEELHKLLPNVPIWLGGPEVSYDAELIIKKYDFLEGIMIGEGEVTFLELLDYYSEKLQKDQIKGIVTREGIYQERELTNISQLPFLYDDLEAFENRIVYYESARGCPYRCSYCLSSIDKSVRFRDMEIIKKELQFFLDRKLPQVKFVDRTFNCNHNHAMEIWNYIKNHDNQITNFHFEIAADIINEEELELLASLRPGLVQLEIGVQSTNDQTLAEINRTMDINKLQKVVSSLQKAENIHLHLDLIAGLPYENLESFQKSFHQVYTMSPEQLQLGFLKVLKGSPMHEKAQEYGICYTSKPPYEVLFTKWLSYVDIQELKKVEEMVELYYNSNQFTYTLPILMEEFKDSYSFFYKLAEFYEKNGYFIQHPSRQHRYEVLLAFALSICPEKEVLYKEVLTFDIYLRENLKSRPSFAHNLDFCKETIRDFYQKEEKNPKVLVNYSGRQSRQMMKMTQMELFYFPVWEKNHNVNARKNVNVDINGNTDISKEPQYFVLFDYEIRNPLNFQARFVVLNKEAMNQKDGGCI